MSDLAPLAEAVTVDPLVGHPADYHVFHKFLERCKSLPAITTAVVWPMSEVALKGTVEAATARLIEPTLIGDEEQMRALARKIGTDISAFPILHAESEEKAAELGVAMCRSGNAQAMMKGSLHTDELMKTAMARDTGLRTARRISHVFIMDTPAYARTLLITDAAINITPVFTWRAYMSLYLLDYEASRSATRILPVSGRARDAAQDRVVLRRALGRARPGQSGLALHPVRNRATAPLFIHVLIMLLVAPQDTFDVLPHA